MAESLYAAHINFYGEVVVESSEVRSVGSKIITIAKSGPAFNYSTRIPRIHAYFTRQDALSALLMQCAGEVLDLAAKLDLAKRRQSLVREALDVGGR
jgi:hypothetical protein